MNMHSFTTQLTPCPAGLMLADVIITKRTDSGRFDIEDKEGEVKTLLTVAYGRPVSAQAMRYVKRSAELLQKVSPEQLEYAVVPSHLRPVEHLPKADDITLARVLIHLALSGLGNVVDVDKARQQMLQVKAQMAKGVPAATLLKALEEYFQEKDYADDPLFNDEYALDGEGDVSSASDPDFESKHPRWQAGDPEGRGGEFREKDNGDYMSNLFVQAFHAANRATAPASQDYTPEYDSAGNPLEGATPSYPLEELIGFISGGEVLDVLRGGAVVTDTAAPAASTAIEDAANAVREYIGNDARMIVNDNGDLILMNDTRKLRFDVKGPHGFDPHFHVQKWNGKEWVDAGERHMYYFKDK